MILWCLAKVESMLDLILDWITCRSEEKNLFIKPLYLCHDVHVLMSHVRWASDKW